jgi:hypothetical protein
MGSRLIVAASIVVLAAVCAWDLRDTPAASVHSSPFERARTAATEEVVTRRDVSSDRASSTTKPIATTPLRFGASP